jgi:hypothetical protein
MSTMYGSSTPTQTILPMERSVVLVSVYVVAVEVRSSISTNYSLISSSFAAESYTPLHKI